MGQQPDVFISYSSLDESAAETVCRVLERNKIRCWIAPRDIPGGMPWDNAIIDGIKATSLVVLIHSSNANGSDQIKKELHLAHAKKKIVIPLRIEKVHPDEELEYILTSVHWLDAFEKPLEDQLEPLVKRVREILQPASQPPPAALSRRSEKSLRVALLYRRKAKPDDYVLSFLEAGLRAAGHQVFIDRHLSIGVEWATEIERQVQESDAVIPLLSALSIQSEMLAGEVEVAAKSALQHSGKPRILPVRIKTEEALPEPFLSILGRLQYHLWQSPADDSDLLAHLLDSLIAKEQSKGKISADLVLPDTPYYMERPADSEFDQLLENQESIVLLKGARQMGKTSLLARALQKARDAGKKVVLLDLQKLNQASLLNIESLYKGLCEIAAERLDLDVSPEDGWRPGRAPNLNFERFVRRELLGKIEGHLILAIDETDRLFEWPYAGEVFALFRTWYNERATEPSGPWKRLTLAIVYATEAHLFITNQNQSPFNVGTKIELQDFTIGQVEELNQLYHSPLRNSDELNRFFELFNGQPFLTRRGFCELTDHKTSLDNLVKSADSDDGPCGDHLRRILLMVSKENDLKAALHGLLHGQPIPDAMTFYRLRSAGIVAGPSAEKAQFRCAIYRKFLARHLV
ncbi:MAG TPA: AAA-like domain-containing protein [Terracidiphilus sp.]|nr:AAA-like domain-containing protein [Terracidiphilus sp.]